MSRTQPVVLGIDPGSRRIGVAVFREAEMIFYGLKSIKKKTEVDTLRKLRNVLAKLVSGYRIEYVVLERAIYAQQQASFVKTVYREIVSFFEQKQIKLLVYDPKFIRKAICGYEKPTKHNTALKLIQRHSELERYINLPSSRQQVYYWRMFGAIAAAITGVEAVKHSYTYTN